MSKGTRKNKPSDSKVSTSELGGSAGVLWFVVCGFWFGFFFCLLLSCFDHSGLSVYGIH